MHRCTLLLLFLVSAALPVAGSDPVPMASPVQAVSETYDFGTRSALDQSLIAHTFVLKAWAKAPVTVDHLEPSCRCTQADPESPVDDQGRFTIAPGHTARVDVTVNPNDMAPGEIEKEVYVFVRGDSTPCATLHVHGVITPPVTFSVPALDFGRVTVGTARTLPLTVTLDPRLLVPGQTARLVSSAPGLHVVRQDKALEAARQQTYQITLPTGIRPGKISGTLLMTFSHGDVQTMDWSIPVRAEVVAPPSLR